MYQRNANQRNQTNLILVSFFLSRSSSKPRPKRSQSVRNLKWTICIQNLKSREWTKVKIGKQPRAENLQKASSYFKDKVYTWVADLDTPFTADLYCQKNCYADYFGKWNRATSTPNTSVRTTTKTKRDIFKNYFSFIKLIIDLGRRFFFLSDIRDMIKQDDDADLKKYEIKGFQIKEFGDSISFCDPERKNQSIFAFFSSIEVQEVINSLLKINAVKIAAIELKSITWS